MSTFRLRAKAKEDLEEIIEYTSQNWGGNQRDRYLLELVDAIEMLAENSNIGKKCDFIRRGYKKFPVASHVIFYKDSDDGGVDIVRVLHKSMDVSLSFSRTNEPKQ